MGKHRRNYLAELLEREVRKERKAKKEART